MRDGHRGLRRLLEEHGDRNVQYKTAGGDALGEYAAGHMDALDYVSWGSATSERLYSLARQFGFAPVTGRLSFVCFGLHDPEVRQ